MELYAVRPIGHVESPYRAALPRYDPPHFATLRSTIILDEEHCPGLLGLEPGMEVVVLCFFDRARREGFPYHIHPRGDPKNPLTGLWNSRSPNRPNPISLSTVRIEQIEGCRLTVTGLDAFDGTPVLDLKRSR